MSAPGPADSPGPRRHRLAVIAGDGIGVEVVPAALDVLTVLGQRFGFQLDSEHLPWGSDFYRTTGAMMPPDGLAQLAGADAIFLGAVGAPGVPDHVTLWGLLIPIRRAFRQYANVRPIRLLPGVPSPLASAGAKPIDLIVVRENNEGEYSEVGGRLYRDSPDEMAVQESVFTRRGVDRIMRYAFELASGRPAAHVTSATKSNGIVHTMPFWDERFRAMARDFPRVGTDEVHIDALCAYFVQRPESFDVVVASNLFGDILSDLGAAVVGSIGVAPSGNINPERDYPSMFEPVHGSAPDIAGRGVANPIGQIWTGAMMLEHLGEAPAAAALMSAVEEVLERPDLRTADLGGTATTSVTTAAIIERLESG